MNDYGARPDGRGGGVAGAGSVKRARERMEAGLPPDVPRAKAPSPNSNRRPVQQEGSSIGENAIGVAISRPMPASQWPLRDAVSDPAYRPPPGRSIAPQRPPRPSRVPSILDSSQPQEHVPAFAYNTQVQRKPVPPSQYPDEDLFSPDYNNPRTPETPSGGSGSGSGSSSRPSTLSSVGTIPDFPLPTLAQVGRRSGNLGPPPTSRRGASSYYSSHTSYVSPIPEESLRAPQTPRTHRSHSSYASSAAIPSSWGSESPGYYYDGDQSPGFDRGNIMSEHGIIEEGRESRESNYDGNEEQSLVRQASIGKRGKPALIDTKSTESMNSAMKAQPPPQPALWGLSEDVAPNTAVAAAIAAGFASGREPGMRETVWPTGDDLDTPVIPNITSDSTTFDPNRPSTGSEPTNPSTASSETVPTVGRAISSSERMSYKPSLQQPIPSMPNRSDARVSRILGAHEAASAINPLDPPLERQFSRLSAIRRPPRLNIDAVRDAEARGSLTSLPDLIRRATRLAAMMDKGRRPASRFDWSTSPGGKSVAGMERELEPMDFRLMNEKRQTGGLGDMLAAFPAPGLATPSAPSREGARSDSRSPQFLNEKSSFDEAKQPGNGKKQRRCCGLPLCGFIIIIIVVLLAVIAGIVVPIELLVVHKAKPKPPPALTLESCTAQVTCLNGGMNDISSGVCSCICVNNFTGATCASDANTVGCTTADIANSVNNVTLGSSLPRLIQDATTNFSIPLKTNTILSRLNAANLSCVSQNSLVALNGGSDRAAVSSQGLSAAALAVVQNGIIFSTSVTGSAEIAVTVPGGGPATKTVKVNGNANSETVTIELSGASTSAASAAAATTTSSSVTIDLEGTSTAPKVTVSLGSTTARATASTTASTTTSTTAATSSTSSSAVASASFVASQEMLDFARVAVLYVLQQKDLSSAAKAQTKIQSFLTSSSSTNAGAQNFSIGVPNTIDLINFAVDVGNGTIGSLTSAASKSKRRRRDSHASSYHAF